MWRTTIRTVSIGRSHLSIGQSSCIRPCHRMTSRSWEMTPNRWITTTTANHSDTIASTSSHPSDTTTATSTDDFEPVPHFRKLNTRSRTTPILRSQFDKLDAYRMKLERLRHKIANLTLDEFHNTEEYKQLRTQVDVSLNALFELESQAPTLIQHRLQTREFNQLFHWIHRFELFDHAFPFWQLFSLHLQLHWRDLTEQYGADNARPGRVKAPVISNILEGIIRSSKHGPRMALSTFQWMKEKSNIFDIHESHFTTIIRYWGNLSTDPPKLHHKKLVQLRTFFESIPSEHRSEWQYYYLITTCCQRQQPSWARQFHRQWINERIQSQSSSSSATKDTISSPMRDVDGVINGFYLKILRSYLSCRPFSVQIMRRYFDTIPVKTPIIRQLMQTGYRNSGQPIEALKLKAKGVERIRQAPPHDPSPSTASNTESVSSL